MNAIHIHKKKKNLFSLHATGVAYNAVPDVSTFKSHTNIAYLFPPALSTILLGHPFSHTPCPFIQKASPRRSTKYIYMQFCTKQVYTNEWIVERPKRLCSLLNTYVICHYVHCPYQPLLLASIAIVTICNRYRNDKLNYLVDQSVPNP